MTSRDRFLFWSVFSCSLALGAFVAIAGAEGVLVLAIPAFFVFMVFIASLSAWAWRDQQREQRAAGPPARASGRIVVGGVLQLALVAVTIALILGGKGGLALVTGLLAATIAFVLARYQRGQAR